MNMTEMAKDAFYNLSTKQKMDLIPEGIDQVLFGLRGSIAHGVYLPDTDPNGIDDIDLIGVFVGPVRHYIGFGVKDVHERFVEQFDMVTYEIRKFIDLVYKANPNVLALLWNNPEHILGATAIGQMLLDNRDMFSSKLAYNSFVGYARGQLKRMTHFNIEAQELMAALEEAVAAEGVDPVELNATQEQRDAVGTQIDRLQDLRKKYYSGGRLGAKRRGLVNRFGYDVKNGAHMIRLLRMGVEFLDTGKLNVFRPDAAEILEIKTGQWTLEAVQAEADRLFANAADAVMRSKLPETPDRVAVERLCMRAILTHHNIKPEGGWLFQ